MVSLEGQEFHQFRVDEEFLAAEGHFGEHADFGQLLEAKKTCRDFWVFETGFDFVSQAGTGCWNAFDFCDFCDMS